MIDGFDYAVSGEFAYRNKTVISVWAVRPKDDVNRMSDSLVHIGEAICLNNARTGEAVEKWCIDPWSGRTKAAGERFTSLELASRRLQELHEEHCNRPIVSSGGPRTKLK